MNIDFGSVFWNRNFVKFKHFEIFLIDLTDFYGYPVSLYVCKCIKNTVENEITLRSSTLILKICAGEEIHCDIHCEEKSLSTLNYSCFTIKVTIRKTFRCG